MGVVWNVWALPGLLALVTAGSVALFVYLTRPEGVQNRRLALQLGMEGFVVAVLGGGVWLLDDPRWVWALTGAATFLVWPKLWSYYNFLATLPTPLARPLRSPARLRVFLGLTLVAGMSWFLWPEFYYAGVGPVPWAAAWVYPGSGFWLIMNMWALMWLVGLTFSISAYRNAPTEIARGQARAYILAFGTRDVLFGLITLALTLTPATSPYWLALFVAFPLVWVVYPVLVGYGILKHQLFDIDLKLKWTVRQSTVAAVFVAVAFVVSEGAAQLFSDQWGPMLGLLAAGGLVFAMAPLQRFAERVSNAAMPGVGTTPDYVAYRKMEVYRAALEGAYQDGALTGHEDRVLSNLRRELGISDADASALAEDVRTSFTQRGVPS